jgi:hypothetical protein
MNAHRDFRRLAISLGMSESELLDADAAKIDRRWLSSQDPASRTLWRAARDRWFRHVLHSDGERALTGAGFVDDGASARSLPIWEDQARFLTTPLHLARANLARAQGRRPAVVLSTGAYSPVHPGHLSVLECA